jgi:alpha-methylacyl-CoA racemase
MSLLTPYYSMAASGMHTEEMGSNLFDGGAPFYNVYETKDGKYVSVAPIEPHFYALLVEKMGLDLASLPDQNDRRAWPELRERFSVVFKTRTRDEWCEILEGTDACFAPVLSFGEAQTYPHHEARGVFRPGGGMPELAPSPRLSRTPGEPGGSPAYAGADTDAVLEEFGFDRNEIAELRERGAVK